MKTDREFNRLKKELENAVDYRAGEFKKLQEENELLRTNTGRQRCFKCHGHTPLYCRNCANELNGWQIWHDIRNKLVFNFRSGMDWKTSIDKALRDSMPTALFKDGECSACGRVHTNFGCDPDAKGATT